MSNKLRMIVDVNESQSSTASSRSREQVVGSCSGSLNKYNHDFLHCPDCVKARESMLKCNLTNCPCKGEGFLFRIGSSSLNCKKFAHQHPDQERSVRFHWNRPDEALKRIKKLKNKKVKKTKITTKKVKSVRQKRNRDNNEKEDSYMSIMQSNSKKSKVEKSCIVENNNDVPIENTQDNLDNILREEIGDFPANLAECENYGNDIDYHKVFD